MIEVIAGTGNSEAERLRTGLDAMGFDARVLSGPAGPAADGKPRLVHVSALNGLAPLTPEARIVAFGGSDRAADAVRVLRGGALEYLPDGVPIDKVCGCLRDLLAAAPVPAPAAAPVIDDPAQLCASPAMQQTFDLARRVARADIAVLVSGESGTGKEVVARYIHKHSARRDGPFVALNCAAIPETMLEALLFGHDKGAFTGATEKRMGKFELADGGTLLLDEITEMPVTLQAKLLRVLQEKEVERVGGSRPKAVDVRVIATSNRNLAQAVSEGVLREDLYYRLSVFPLELPALRHRSEDILPLARHFLTKHGAAQPLAAAAEQHLLHHPWPGNVRELENCMQRALVLSDAEEIQVADLGLQAGAVPAAGADNGDSLAAQVRSTEDQLVLQTLAANNGVRKSTAIELGISERTLRYKLKQLRDRGALA